MGGFGTRPYGEVAFNEKPTRVHDLNGFWVILRMDEDVDIGEGTGGWIGVEIGDEGPAFENNEFDVVLLEGREEPGEMVFVEEIVGDELEVMSC